MTLFLLDENVLRELHSKGNANVRRWIATLDDTNLRLSAATLFEKRRGAEALKRRDPDRAAKLLAAIDTLEKAFELCGNLGDDGVSDCLRGQAV